MGAWKEKENIDFDFIDVQLAQVINSEDEDYIKRRCRDRIGMASTFLMLIGEDTRHKHKYVRWEAEVAIEKKCRLIGVNLDNWRFMNPDTCPKILQNSGALFVPFSPHIIQTALQSREVHNDRDWNYKDDVYTKLGYLLSGNTAILIPKPKPWEPQPRSIKSILGGL
jgi:hypothetical protein